MVWDTRAFIAACPVCAQEKSTHQPPAGLLHPLPIPRHPWLHIAVDLIMGCPPSGGNTTILMVVDRFSKAAKFLSLPNLPLAVEMGGSNGLVRLLHPWFPKGYCV